MARVTATNRIVSTRTNSILYNGGFEVAPSVLTAQTSTANTWINGTAAGSTANTGLGWATSSITSSASAGFDNTVSHSGTYSIKLSTLDATGQVVVGNDKTTPAAANLYQLFLLKPNTQYKLVGWIKTNNVAANSAFIDLREYSASAANLATTSSTKFSGTNASFIQVTFTVTTNASTVFGQIFLRNNIAGNVGDAWFDDITLVQTATSRSVATGRSVA
jgi:hypothetical protein